MRDEVRDLAKELSFDEEDDYLFETYGEEFSKRRFMGMTSIQQFVVSLLLLAAIVVIGSLCLLLTEKIALLKPLRQSRSIGTIEQGKVN